MFPSCRILGKGGSRALFFPFAGLSYTDFYTVHTVRIGLLDSRKEAMKRKSSFASAFEFEEREPEDRPGIEEGRGGEGVVRGRA